MKHYLAIYTGSPASMQSWDQLPEAERQARAQRGIAAWHAWGAKHADAIVDGGGPLSRTKRVDASGIADIRNAMAAYVIVRAESQQAAAEMFTGHPHFTMFPGEGVEIMECLPIPAM